MTGVCWLHLKVQRSCRNFAGIDCGGKKAVLSQKHHLRLRVADIFSGIPQKLPGGSGTPEPPGQSCVYEVAVQDFFFVFGFFLGFDFDLLAERLLPDRLGAWGMSPSEIRIKSCEIGLATKIEE